MKVLMIHGLGQQPSSWDKTVSYFEEPIHPVCPDLFAMLQGQDATYSNLYQQFSAFCKEIADPLHLCGLSLGGILALHYAADFPKKVQSLVLIGAQYQMPKAMLKIQNVVFRLMPPSVFQKMGVPKRDMIQLADSMCELDFRSRLSGITCPACILCGETDRANQKAAEGLAEFLPNAELHKIANAGHEVNLDNPKGLALQLEAFYQGIL